MNKQFNSAILALFIAVLGVVFGVGGANAQSIQFNTTLSYGMANSAEVTKLQNFLIGQGFLKANATGNFLGLTKQALMAFQASQGIEAIGIFGPLTRAAANRIALSQATHTSQTQEEPSATISQTSVKSNNSGLAAVFLAKEKMITWKTDDYPAGVGVNINLIKKVSDNPRAFTLVKVIAANTANDGHEKWNPASGETGENMYIEVTCPSDFQFTQGCKLAGEPVALK